MQRFGGDLPFHAFSWLAFLGHRFCSAFVVRLLFGWFSLDPFTDYDDMEQSIALFMCWAVPSLRKNTLLLFIKFLLWDSVNDIDGGAVQEGIIRMTKSRKLSQCPLWVVLEKLFGFTSRTMGWVVNLLLLLTIKSPGLSAFVAPLFSFHGKGLPVINLIPSFTHM